MKNCGGSMEDKIDIKVDAEIKAFLTPLTARELEGLKADIEKNGIREPLIIWEEECILLDGHNRYMIAQELGIKFPVNMMKFDSREEVLEWMAENQMGRRNLDAGQRGTIVADIIFNELNAHSELTKKAKKTLSVFTTDKYAKIFDVGKTNIQMARKVKQTNPELFNKVKKGEISLKKANSESTKRTECAERNQQIELFTKKQIEDEMEKVIDILVGKNKAKNDRIETLENSLKAALEQIDKQKIIINDMETAEGQETISTNNWGLVMDGQKKEILLNIAHKEDCLVFKWKGSDRTGISFINDNDD